MERDTFLLRRYSTIQDIEAARDRLLRELDILIAILNSQRDTLSQQLERHQAAALAEAYGRDIARFAELVEIVALRRQMSVSPSSP